MWGLSRVIFILFFIFVWEEWRRDWEPANTQWSLSGKETGSKFKDGKSKSTIKYKRERKVLLLLCVFDLRWGVNAVQITRVRLQQPATSGVLNPMTFPCLATLNVIMTMDSSLFLLSLKHPISNLQENQEINIFSYNEFPEISTHHFIHILFQLLSLGRR